MKTCVLALLLLVGLSPTALAGAWPREKGELYLSLATYQGIDTDGAPYTTQELYAEYGLTPRLTLAFDGYDTLNPENARLVLFLRRGLGPQTGAHRLAATLGLGKDGPQDAIVLRLGGAWGYGLQNGWLGLNAHLDFLTTQTRPDLKAEELCPKVVDGVIMRRGEFA